MVPVLCVEPLRRLDRPGRLACAGSCSTRGSEFPHTKAITTILFHDSFPVDIRHNSKIFREKLAVWAARKLR